MLGGRRPTPSARRLVGAAGSSWKGPASGAAVGSRVELDARVLRGEAFRRLRGVHHHMDEGKYDAGSDISKTDQIPGEVRMLRRCASDPHAGVCDACDGEKGRSHTRAELEFS